MDNIKLLLIKIILLAEGSVFKIRAIYDRIFEKQFRFLGILGTFIEILYHHLNSMYVRNIPIKLGSLLVIKLKGYLAQK